MNGNGTKNQNDITFNLSEIMNLRVDLNEKKIGRLADIIIMENGKIPEVTYLVVKRPFGNPTLMVPWDKVKVFDDKKVVIDIDDLRSLQGDPKDDALLLKDHILDKKILDLEDTEVEVVYDLKLVLRGGKMFVTAVDSSRYGRLRRLGFRRTADSPTSGR